MKIVNIFTQHTDYLNTLCKNASEMELNYCGQCTYNAVPHTEIYTAVICNLYRGLPLRYLRFQHLVSLVKLHQTFSFMPRVEQAETKGVSTQIRTLETARKA